MSRRSRRAQRGNDLPWILGFGVLIAAILIGFVLLSGVFSGGGEACEEPLLPLGETPADTSAAGVQQEYIALGQVLGQVEAGNRAAAEQLFFGEVHNYTHNVDEPLRERDEEAGRELCLAVLELEEDLTANVSDSELEQSVLRVREAIADAAVAFGHARPGG